MWLRIDYDAPADEFLYVGWPTTGDGEAWGLKTTREEAYKSEKPFGNIYNARDMDERCRLIERFGGEFYVDPRECLWIWVNIGMYYIPSQGCKPVSFLDVTVRVHCRQPSMILDRTLQSHAAGNSCKVIHVNIPRQRPWGDKPTEYPVAAKECAPR
jgi:hypothetical protein